MTQTPKQTKLFAMFGCCSGEDESNSEVLVTVGVHRPEEPQNHDETVKILSPIQPQSNYQNSRFNYSSNVTLSTGDKENLTGYVGLTPEGFLRPLHPSPVNLTIPHPQLKTQPIMYRAVQQQRPTQMVGNMCYHPAIQ